MKPPRIPSVFKLGEYNRNKSFAYKPRIYDEQKERLEKRQREIDAELKREKGLGNAYEDHLRERISQSWSRKETHRQQRNSSIRLLVILGILMVVLYLIARQTDLFENIDFSF